MRGTRLWVCWPERVGLLGGRPGLRAAGGLDGLVLRVHLGDIRTTRDRRQELARPTIARLVWWCAVDNGAGCARAKIVKVAQIVKS